MGTLYRRPNSAYLWVRYRDREGRIIKESTKATDPQEAERFLRERLAARDEGRLGFVLAGKNLTFNKWADWFLEHRSKPPYRAEKTHRENLGVLKRLRPVFGPLKLSEITSGMVEDYVERRLRSERRINTKFGVERRGTLKPATVHRDFRILRRMLNVAVKQKRLTVNPCQAAEFPVRVSATTRKPHYLTASEQQRIEFFAPPDLRNALIILVEMGLRPYKELTPMRKNQVDLENGVAHIPDSKSANGVADMPMTEQAKIAFEAQIKGDAGFGVFVSVAAAGVEAAHHELQEGVGCDAQAGRRAALSALPPAAHVRDAAERRGVADHFVTQLLRQGDATVFKRYSQAKLVMMREALAKLDRQANERTKSSGTSALN